MTHESLNESSECSAEGVMTLTRPLTTGQGRGTEPHAAHPPGRARPAGHPEPAGPHQE